MIRKKSVGNKSQIISEYLCGDLTFLQLEQKHGVAARTIQSWVRSFRLKNPVVVQKPDSVDDVKKLKKQLEDAQLKNELLEEMLRLSEEQTGLDLRKKFGSRQS
jgi:transposase-like protein